jgi:hypothetical protein
MVVWMLVVGWFLHRQDTPRHRKQRQPGPAE